MAIPKNCTLPLTPFTVHHSDAELAAMRTLLELSPLAKPTYAGTQPEMGVTSEWMRDAKEMWLDPERFDWRAVEAKLNAFPQYTAQVTDTHTLHFVALFSPNPNAVPLLLLHGWPGSHYEFFPLLHELAKTPGKYHVIVPSLPGYCYSSAPPASADFSVGDVAALMDALMRGLGLSEYVVQGGDIGSFLARILTRFDACRGCMLNMWTPTETDPNDGPVLPQEELPVSRRAQWEADGRAYAHEHATRPSTIAHILSASPLALLAWLGEKFLTWPDPDAPLPKALILEMASLWWLTQTFASSIYPYRELHTLDARGEMHTMIKIEKPWGFSWFPRDIVVFPESWIEGVGGCLYFRHHESGGHFAALEKPVELATDLAAFIRNLDAKEMQAEMERRDMVAAAK
ncbi:hypothetical protein EDC01DRAFT_622398 [Geopyxis carbonaria]|nr:hypothetical protein EDC01DRAFT_622398 [Geopyxis carbonaria]